jgi:hypothetical protein
LGFGRRLDLDEIDPEQAACADANPLCGFWAGQLPGDLCQGHGRIPASDQARQWRPPFINQAVVVSVDQPYRPGLIAGSPMPESLARASSSSIARLSVLRDRTEHEHLLPSAALETRLGYLHER